MATEPVPAVEPVPLPAPQRGDRATFSGRVDAFITWLTVGIPQLAVLAENVLHNAIEAFNSSTAATQSAQDATDNGAEQVGLATTQAGIAVGAAQAAGENADAAAASAGQAAADRAQTGLDRAATTADRAQTDEDRQAVADMLGSIADGPVASVNAKTGVVQLVASDIAPYIPITGPTTLQQGQLYGVDTTAGAFAITLPADPAPGVRVALFDSAFMWGDSPPIVARSGSPIMGIAEDMTLDAKHLSVELVYVNSTMGWVMV